MLLTEPENIVCLGFCLNVIMNKSVGINETLYTANNNKHKFVIILNAFKFPMDFFNKLSDVYFFVFPDVSLFLSIPFSFSCFFS